MKVMHLGALTALCGFFLCAWAAENHDRTPPSFSDRNLRYQLSKGDTLDLKFPLTPEFDQTITIQPDGYVTLRGLGDVRIEGKTLPELRTLLGEQYASILRDPQISISLKDFAKPYVMVTGEVKTPGRQEWRGEMTALEAVAAAGGINEDAKHSQVLLLRRVSSEWVEVKQLNVKRSSEDRI